MRLRTATRSAAALAVILLASCAGLGSRSGPTEPPSLPGAAGTLVPAELSAEEKERMALDALGRAMGSGDYESALGRLVELVELDPGNRSYPALRSALCLSLGRTDEARALLSAELAAYPDNVEALYALAELERFVGNTGAHRAAIEAIVARHPGDSDALTSLGDIHYDAKNYRKAEESYDAALAAEPGNAEALKGLARVKFRRDDAKGALALLDKAVAAAPDDAIAYLDRSRALYELGRYAECEADMDKAVELAPGSSWNYVERGRLYLDTGRLELAEADLSESIRLNPDYFLPYVYRASIRENSGDDEAALADYKAAARLYPDYWYSLESMGVLAYRLGDWKTAFASFDGAAGYTKAHPEYYVAAALSLYRGGDARAAKEYAGKKLPLIDRGKHQVHWLALRLVYDQGEMTAEAELAIGAEKSLDIKAGALFYLGSYWIAKGRQELGLKYLRLSYDSERIGTIERRMAEADLARLAAGD